jgi:hypothetical protein
MAPMKELCLFLLVSFGINPFSGQNSTTVNSGSSIATSTVVIIISKIIFALMNYNRTSQNLEKKNQFYLYDYMWVCKV